MEEVHRAPEPVVLAPLIERARLGGDERERIENIALGLLAELREGQRTGWVNQFLQEYQLNSSEGIALLSLAEAFLRVPDPDTADLLISDKIGDGDWRSHRGNSHSGLVNSATWGLVIGRALVGEEKRANALKRLISRTGEPFVRQAVGAAMRMMGEIFVMGRTIDEAIKRMKRPENKGFTASFDMLGEAARTFPDAERYFQAYVRAIEAVGAARGEGGTEVNHSISVKLSALHPRYEVAQWGRCVPELTERLEALAEIAAKANIGLTVDAEESERLEMSFDIIEAIAELPGLKGWNGFGMAIQAYGKRAQRTIGWAEALASRTGRIMPVRLVKGAYWDSEIKQAQEKGLADYPLFTRKAATDVCYLACARDMLEASAIRPAFATHNALTAATIMEWADDPESFEFQRLHGMGEGLFEKLVRERGYRCRIYAPVGGHRDLLAYLVRRLLENGANSSFVHQLADEQLSDADLLADPVAKVEAVGGTRHPSIPLPEDLFMPQRKNSKGLDLEDWRVLNRVTENIISRADIGEEPAAATDVAALVARAGKAFPAWSDRPIEERAACLDRLANLYEDRLGELMALAVHEANKTLPDALSEVREAIDFCRYYAAEARDKLLPLELPGPTGESNVLRMEGKGVWACIAPWNFPLAIFTGQIAAALVAGNTVIAKPAPQTPRIAHKAVVLAHKAGIPVDALILASGGPEVGAALTGDPRVVGVAFTGSTATAKAIARSLLDDEERPIVPLIAETGGVNAMIVDSTALPEQVVADVITSAFGSAGQRCSALRLLLIQEDVADEMIAMLKGAMETLVIGDPSDPATDVGPVIDDAAYEKLMDHRAAMEDRWLATCDVPEAGRFVPPTLIAIDSVDDLNREWFGPLLHVATWKSGEIEKTIARINAKGFGLTMGLHSRIARVSELVEDHARIGNLYVNRSMIGAVVGSQPFGGEGLSGTGPKAGGPHYLPRFCAERTTTIDTTSAGGNATLLSLEEAGQGI
ncbi:MAG: L-glutamate gamma-semialdehyde dehydrogenase [Sphingomonadaceae bacterium]|nr:L-glutamate gamma-semialdehyde dehydrogenase [Sphingomonadaceae bacterium]